MKTKLVLILAILWCSNLIFAQSVRTDTVIHDLSNSISQPNEPIAYAHVDVKPVFPGGDSALLEFIAANTEYPLTNACPIQGRVFVEFIIDEDGKVTNPKIVKGVDPFLDAEALRVASILPNWIPGKQNDKNVPVSYIIPVTFVLK
jgi:periplasmic protein TonB